MICINCMNSELQNNICPVCGFHEAAYAPAPCHLPLRTILSGRYLTGTAVHETNTFIIYNGWDNDNNKQVEIHEYFPRLFVSRTSASNHSVSVFPGRESAFSKSKAEHLAVLENFQTFSSAPGILVSENFFKENNTFYYITSHSKKQTLEAFLQTHKQIPEDILLPLLNPLLKSLWTLHSAGHYHGMISPKQIYVNYDSAARFCFRLTPAQKSRIKENIKPHNIELSGFESACFVHLDGCTMDDLNTHSPFLPLEVYHSKVGAPADIYSLAAVIYKALTGKVPASPIERLHDDSLINLFDKNLLSSELAQSFLSHALKPLAADRLHSLKELYAGLFQLDIDSTDTYYSENPRKKYTRANNYYLGINNCKQNYEKAFHLYQDAANHGHRLAQCCLGICYYLGDGTEPNMELAKKWLTLSAKQGTISAQNNLYLLFDDHTFVSDFHLSGQARSRIQTLCKNFEEKSPHKIYTVRPNLIAGLDINDQTVFLGHDDTWMKSGKDGFAITNKELACRYIFEDVKKISYETFLKSQTLKNTSDGIFADDIRIAYCCNSAANEELLKLYQDIQRILLRP